LSSCRFDFCLDFFLLFGNFWCFKLDGFVALGALSSLAFVQEKTVIMVKVPRVALEACYFTRFAEAFIA